MSAVKRKETSVLDTEDEESVNSKYFKDSKSDTKEKIASEPNKTCKSHMPAAEENTARRKRGAGNNDNEEESVLSKHQKNDGESRITTAVLGEQQTESKTTELKPDVRTNDSDENVKSKYFKNSGNNDGETPLDSASDKTNRDTSQEPHLQVPAAENKTIKLKRVIPTNAENDKTERHNSDEHKAETSNTRVKDKSGKQKRMSLPKNSENDITESHTLELNTAKRNIRKLSRVDFRKNGIHQARYLLGKIINRHTKEGVTLRGRIVETEAYLGVVDKACHTYGDKRTERTQAMYMVEGTAYVYSIYGNQFCLNISSSDLGGATLIRGLEPLEGIFLFMHSPYMFIYLFYFFK